MPYIGEMDFSGIIIIPLSAAITAVVMIGTALLSRRSVGFGLPFGLSFLLGVILLQPWLMIRSLSDLSELPMIFLMFALVALWVAAGCLIGGVPTAIAIAIGSKLAARAKRN